MVIQETGCYIPANLGPNTNESPARTGFVAVTEPSLFLSAGAFGLSAVALLLAALVAFSILAPRGHVGGPGTSSQVGSLRTEGNLHVDRNSSVSGSLNVTGPTSLNSLTTTADSRLSSVKLTGALSSEATLTGTQFISTVGSGHPPLVVNSSAVVPNLHAANSDQLGGSDAGFYLNSGGGPQSRTGPLSVGSLVTGALTASGEAHLGGMLTVGGPATLGSSLAVEGSTALGGGLQVTGNATVSGGIVAAGGLGVTGDTLLNGDLTVSGGTINGSMVGNLSGNASTAGSADDAARLGGNAPGFYLDTSAAAQAKAGELEAGGIHSTTTLQVDAGGQFNGALAAGGPAVGNFTLTVNGPTFLSRDVSGSSYLRGRAPCVTAAAHVHALNCKYEGGVTLGDHTGGNHPHRRWQFQWRPQRYLLLGQSNRHHADRLQDLVPRRSASGRLLLRGRAVSALAASSLGTTGANFLRKRKFAVMAVLLACNIALSVVLALAHFGAAPNPGAPGFNASAPGTPSSSAARTRRRSWAT